MKKLFTLLAICTVLTLGFTVYADDIRTEKLDNGIFSMEIFHYLGETTTDYGATLHTIDTNSSITLNTYIDDITIFYNTDESTEMVYSLSDSLELSQYVTISGEMTTRKVSEDMDITKDIFLPNARIQFYTPGQYSVFFSMGAASLEEYNALFEASQSIETDDKGGAMFPEYGFVVLEGSADLDWGMSDPGMTVSPNEDYNTSITYYDDSLMSVSGIIDYVWDGINLYGTPEAIARCGTETVIEAKRDMMNFMIIPLINIDGNWVESMPIIPEGCSFSEIGFIAAPAGTKVTLTQPGLYNIWTETIGGEFTGLVVEISSIPALYTDSKVMVDGKEVAFEAYKINDNNYFKLRDIAKVLSGTPKQFEVTWNSAIEMVNMISGIPYTEVGGELVPGDGLSKTASKGTSNIAKDESPVQLTAYMIGGNNYFKLRDLGILFDFDVSWDGENNCVMIDSSASYTAD